MCKWCISPASHLSVAVALQQQEVREVERRVDGVLGGVVVAALRLLLLHAEPQHLLVGLGLRILPELGGALPGPAGLLPRGGQVHLAETPPDAEAVGVLAAAVHQQRGHPGAALLQLTGLSVDAWTDPEDGYCEILRYERHTVACSR